MLDEPYQHKISFIPKFHNFTWNMVNTTCQKLSKFHKLTWNMVNTACQKVSKLCLSFCASGAQSNLPPKTCIPSKAKIIMKRNNRRRREKIDWIELRREPTRLERDFQYLKIIYSNILYSFQYIYIVSRDQKVLKNSSGLTS